MSNEARVTEQGTDVWGAVLADLRDDILSNGGKTWSPYGTEPPTTGYMVSLPDKEERISLAAFTEHGETFLSDYTTYYADAIYFDERWFGAWVDDGWVYLDISEHVPGRGTARALARMRNQLAIYNLSTGEAETV